MAKWTAFPHAADAYTYDSGALKKKWTRLLLSLFAAASS